MISVAEESGTVVLPFTSECQSLLIYNQVLRMCSLTIECVLLL